MFKLIFVFCFCVNVFAIGISVPASVSESVAVFESLSNSSLTTQFLTCDNDYQILFSLEAYATSTGKISVCTASSAAGVCSTAGNTTSSFAKTIAESATIFLGYTKETNSHSASEVTTFTKWDGDWIIKRRCVSSDFVR